jgi:hypothetical protein
VEEQKKSYTSERDLRHIPIIPSFPSPSQQQVFAAFDRVTMYEENPVGRPQHLEHACELFHRLSAITSRKEPLQVVPAEEGCGSIDRGALVTPCEKD